MSLIFAWPTDLINRLHTASGRSEEAVLMDSVRVVSQSVSMGSHDTCVSEYCHECTWCLAAHANQSFPNPNPSSPQPRIVQVMKQEQAHLQEMADPLSLCLPMARLSIFRRQATTVVFPPSSQSSAPSVCRMCFSVQIKTSTRQAAFHRMLQWADQVWALNLLQHKSYNPPDGISLDLTQ